jgi:hypothetical protein
MFTQRTTSCDQRCGVYGAKVECPQGRAAGSCGILDMDFRELFFRNCLINRRGTVERLCRWHEWRRKRRFWLRS